MKKILFLLFLIPAAASAQYNLTLYHLNHTVPQANFINPGLMPYGQVNIGFPGLSNLHFSYSNSISAKDLFVKENDKLILQLEQLPDKLGKQNYLQNNVRVDPLYVGFWAKKNYFSLSLSARQSFTFGYPRELIEYIVQGNGGANLGKKVAIDDMIFKSQGFVEFGLGYGRSVLNDRLTVGGRIKYLYGGYHVAIDKGSSGYLVTDPETYAISLNVEELRLNSAGLTAADIDLFEDGNNEPEDEEFEDFTDYLLNNDNRGLAIDLGGSFKLTPELMLHASILDLGSIKWQSDVKNYSFNNANYTFEGIDIKNADDFDEALTDTLEAIFDPVETEMVYREALTSKFYAGADYQLGKKHSAGAMVYGQFIRGKIRSALNIHYNLQLGRMVNAVVTYNIMNRSANNLGTGLSLNLGFWQIYAATDDIFSYFYTSKAKNLDFQFGMNMTFGRKRHERIMEGKPKSRKGVDING